jgi:hypothetical protein
VGDVVLVDCTAGRVPGTRGRREIADAEDRVALLVVLAGSERVEQAGVTTLLQPGSALLWDAARPARFAVPGPLRKRTSWSGAPGSPRCCLPGGDAIREGRCTGVPPPGC